MEGTVYPPLSGGKSKLANVIAFNETIVEADHNLRSFVLSVSSVVK